MSLWQGTAAGTSDRIGKEVDYGRAASFYSGLESKDRHQKKQKLRREAPTFFFGKTATSMMDDRVQEMEALTNDTVNSLWRQPWRKKFATRSKKTDSPQLPNGSSGGSRSVNSQAFGSKSSGSLGDEKESGHLELLQQREKSGPFYRFWQWVPVFHPENTFRNVWNLIFAFPLLYIATVFPYRMAFVEMRVTPVWPLPVDANGSAIEYESPDGAKQAFVVVDAVVDAVFWFDLLLQFTFAFENTEGVLVSHPKDIGKSYLATWFVVDILACVPPALWAIFAAGDGNGSNRLGRIARLYRIAKIFRLGKLAKISSIIKYAGMMRGTTFFHYLMQTFGKSRVIEILKFMLSLLALSHIFACGWYLIAALNPDPTLTWVWRRYIQLPDDIDLQRLVDTAPAEQWLHSLYYVLTVFTTVGFGDITPFTMEELIYSMFLMLIGAIVNSIIISEVIHVVTRTDVVRSEIRGKAQAITQFCEATKLSVRTESILNRFAEVHTKTKFAKDSSSANLNPSKSWKDLCEIAEAMEPHFRYSITQRLFDGLYFRNHFLLHCVNKNSPDEMRSLPIVVAGFLKQQYIWQGEYMYHIGEQPKGMWLIMRGFVAFVAVPSELGGIHHKRTITNMMKIDVLNVNSQKDTSSPYMLFGPQSYIGEWEVLYPRDRLTNCRVEADGVVAYLARKDFVMICNRYPNLAHTLKMYAQRKETRRRIAIFDHKQELSYRQLAAQTIQKWFRALRRKFVASDMRKAFNAKLTIQAGGEGMGASTALDGEKRSKFKNAIERIAARAERMHGVAVADVMHDADKLMKKIDDELGLEQLQERAGPARSGSKNDADEIDALMQDLDLDDEHGKGGTNGSSTSAENRVKRGKSLDGASRGGSRDQLGGGGERSSSSSNKYRERSPGSAVGSDRIDKHLRRLSTENEKLEEKLAEIFRMTQDMYFANFGREM